MTSELRRATRIDADQVASPCISVCQMDDASGLCIGCFRTLDEIAAWSLLDADERRAVISTLAARRAAHPALAAKSAKLGSDSNYSKMDSADAKVGGE